MSCSTHQRIPASSWRGAEPTHQAGETSLPGKRAKRQRRLFGMLTVEGEQHVDDLVDRVGGALADGTLDRAGAGQLVDAAVAELADEHPEIAEQTVRAAIDAALDGGR